MDPRQAMDGMGYDMNAYGHPQPPQIFPAYGHDGSPMAGMSYQGAYFGDGMNGFDDFDESDPKRRRIARVSRMLSCPHVRWTKRFNHRLATCAGRRRSSVMGNCQSARTAQTTKPNASSRKSRRRETHRKGESGLPRSGKTVAERIQSEIHRGSREPPGPHGVSPENVWSADGGRSRPN